MSCTELPREQAAAFEARAHAELLVRGLEGSVRLDCGTGSELTWKPVSAAERSARVSDLGTEALLAELETLLDAPTEPADSSEPAEPQPRGPVPEVKPRQGLDLRSGASARSWSGQIAAGGGAAIGFSLPPLTFTASGTIHRGLISYGEVALYLLEARAGVEVTPIERLRLGLGAGAGRPFTTSTEGTSEQTSSPSLWFLEAFFRASTPIRWSRTFRLDAGAEVSVLSRPLRLRVDRTDAYDVAWQPGVFLEAAFELH